MNVYRLIHHPSLDIGDTFINVEIQSNEIEPMLFVHFEVLNNLGSGMGQNSRNQAN
ncbi:hypothetical protein C943_02492 [Mariniradius saccharolyticus AK6]|uniref:Uncharacterized protein n=1 Tax=Mariniradius saccharolyticus AK6 TaxID=1239962 RepID=M7X1H3_9BACT|nr:hypothetical protein C943_02492 [Mariniradius saccharolyticus AK6]